MDVVAISNEHPRLMRRISCLGMEDPAYKTREESFQHPSFIFDDMSVNDVALDMQDLISVASDPTYNEGDRFDAHLVKAATASPLPLVVTRPSNASRSMTKRTDSVGEEVDDDDDDHDQHRHHQSIQSLTVEDLKGVDEPAPTKSSPRGGGNRRRRLRNDSRREVSLPALDSSTLSHQRRSIQTSSSDREKVESFHESLCSLMSSSQSLSLCSPDDDQRCDSTECSPQRPFDGFTGSNSDLRILMTISRSLTEQLSLSKESFMACPKHRDSNCNGRRRDGRDTHASPTPSLCDTSVRAVLPTYQSPTPGIPCTESVLSYEPRALPSLGELFLCP